MAYIIPAITEAAAAGALRGELETLRRLKAGLGPEYAVYHGVHWAAARGGGAAFGEIDFAIVNRDGEVLVVEQKNGALLETGDGLEKKYGANVKSVPAQIARNASAVKGNFRKQNPVARPLRVDCLLYCPDHRVLDVNAAGMDRYRIVDARRRGELADIVAGLLGPGTGADARLAKRVHGFFRQSFEVIPDVHASVDKQQEVFARLNGDLVRNIDRFEQAPRRLRVKGVAGCGKTGVAIHFYERALENGKHPLMLCFNRPLREKLNAVVSDGGVVQTWNGFCGRYLEDCGAPPVYPRGFDQDFWAKTMDRVRERALLNERLDEGWRFDTLIIDEAQDFDPEWIEILKLFLDDDSDILWLEDPNQNIRRTERPLEKGFAGFRADENYRSPRHIAHYIRKALSYEFECVNELPGFPVAVETWEAPEEQPALAAARVAELVRLGFRPDQVTVLTMRGFRNSAMSARDRLGNFTIRRFEDEYDRFGNQKMSDGQIYFDSIHRFKGQEAPAVILCDVDPDPDSLEHWNRLLYCGMTRVAVRLELLANRANPLCAPLIDAAR